MKILFAGGGTLGPVTPLIAIWRQMKHLQPGITAAWVGTPTGPERVIVEAEKIPFMTLPVAKLPRYLSLELLQFPWNYWKASQAAKKVIKQEKPDLVVSVGGYMGTPLILAAKKQGIPCAMHQLDATPGLSNRAIAKYCASVTTTFSYTTSPFRVPSTQIATPCRFTQAYKPQPENTRLQIFILGGGTGAQGLNQLVAKTKKKLTAFADIVHLAGQGKGQSIKELGYTQAEFFTEEQMLKAYLEADIVISRAGIGTLSELAALHKATILVPMPNSHQEENVQILGDAVLSVSQQAENAPEQLMKAIGRFKDIDTRLAYGERLHVALPTDTGEALAKRWLSLIQRGKNVSK